MNLFLQRIKTGSGTLVIILDKGNGEDVSSFLSIELQIWLAFKPRTHCLATTAKACQRVWSVVQVEKVVDEKYPTMKNPKIPPGNGLILYFRTENMNEIRLNVEKLGYSIEEDIHLNPNSRKEEFSLRDPDGYYLTITEFHQYEG